MTAGPRITIRNLSLTLGGTRILRDVNHVFEGGRIHCILGPNGGGKTSLLRCLLGQMPFRGTVRLEDGDDRPIGYVPQSLEFDRSLPLTVGDVMAVMTQRRPAFFGTSRKTRAAMDAALDRIGMLPMRDRRFGALSGGERQRVLFAQAFVPHPALLLLDEPTSNLDEAGDRRFEELVRDISASGTTVIWVNHNWAQARRVSDSVVGVSGTVIFAGPPDEAIPTTPEAIPA